MKLTAEILIKNGFIYDELYKIYKLYFSGKLPYVYEIPAVALMYDTTTVEAVENELNNKNPYRKRKKPIKLKV